MAVEKERLFGGGGTLALLFRLDGAADAMETENDGPAPPPPAGDVVEVGESRLTTVGDGTVNLLLFSMTFRDELERLLLFGSVNGELLLLP